MEIFDEDEYAHRIHFSKNFDCDSDSDKSDFDEWYYKHKPPPVEIHTCDVVKIEPLTAVLYNNTISTVLSEDNGDKPHNRVHGIQEQSSSKKIQKKRIENVIVEIQKPISFFDAVNNGNLFKTPSSCTEGSPENNGNIISKKKHSHRKKKDQSKKTKTFELSSIEWPVLGSTYSSIRGINGKNVNSPLQLNKKKSPGSKDFSEKCDHHVCVSSHTKEFLSESINNVIGQLDTPLLLDNNKKIESVQENKNGVAADFICRQPLVCDTLPSYYNEKESTKLRKNGHSETIDHKAQSLLRNSCNNSEKRSNGKQLLINQKEIDHNSLSTDILNQFIIGNCTQTTKSKKKKSKKSNHPIYEEFNLVSFVWPPLTKVAPSSVDSLRENQSCNLSKNDTNKELIQVTQTPYRKSRTFEKESNKKIEKDMCTHVDTILQNSRKQLKESIQLDLNKKETLEEQDIQSIDAKISIPKEKAANGKKGDQVKLRNISLFNKEHSSVLLDNNHNNIDSLTSGYNTKLESQSCNVLINPNESICTILSSLPLKEADVTTNVIKRRRKRRRKKNIKSEVFESNTLNTSTLASEKGSTDIGVGDNCIASVSSDKQTKQQKEHNNLQFCNTFNLRDVFDKCVQSKCDIKNVINGDKVSTCKSNIDDGTIRGLQPSNVAYKKKVDPLWPKGFLLPSFKKKPTNGNNTKLPSHKDCNKNYDLLQNEQSSQIVYKKREDLLCTRSLQFCFKKKWKQTQKHVYENITQSPTFPVSSISHYCDSRDMLDEIAMNSKIPLNGFVTGGKDFFLLDKLFLPSSFSIYAKPRLAMCNIFLHYYTGY